MLLHLVLLGWTPVYSPLATPTTPALQLPHAFTNLLPGLLPASPTYVLDSEQGSPA